VALNQASWGLLATLGVPLVAAALLVAVRPKGRISGWIAGVAAAIPLVAILWMVPSLQRGEDPTLYLQWVPMAGISMDLHLDWISLPFALVEAGVTLVGGVCLGLPRARRQLAISLCPVASICGGHGRDDAF